MDFSLSPEHENLRKTVRDFAEKEIGPVARERDSRQEFPYDTLRAMAHHGLFGMFVSEEYKGRGMDYISFIIATEEIARVDGSHAALLAAGNSLGIGPLYYYGNDEQKQRYLPRACSGETLWALGLTEPEAGSDAGTIKTTAHLDKNKWVINGSKACIANGATDITAGAMVLCRTGTRQDDQPELTTLIVETGTPGFQAKAMNDTVLWRASATDELSFHNCKVPWDNLLGSPGDGSHHVNATRDEERLAMGALGLGGAQGAFDLALSFSKDRVQFGRPLSSFQINAFKLADMATEIECARLLLYKACWLRDNNKPFSRHAAMATLCCSEIMGTCVNHAAYLHGGYGLGRKNDIERFYRDHKLLGIDEITGQVQRGVISQLIDAV